MADRVVEVAGGRVDAVVAVAGVAQFTPLTMRVNYFGAAASLTLLQPLLAGSNVPRAAVVSSFSALQQCDAELLAALRADDEEAATARAEVLAAQGRGI